MPTTFTDGSKNHDSNDEFALHFIRDDVHPPVTLCKISGYKDGKPTSAFSPRVMHCGNRLARSIELDMKAYSTEAILYDLKELLDQVNGCHDLNSDVVRYIGRHLVAAISAASVNDIDLAP